MTIKMSAKMIAAASALVVSAVCLTACNTQQPAGETKNYVIGATGPLTGTTSMYGLSVQKGATIAIEEINAAGGLNGNKFTFNMIDDGSDNIRAQNGFNTLIEGGMQASIGSVTSGSCAAFAEAANSENVFVLTPSASSESVIAKGNQTFRVCFGDAQQGTLAADTLVAQYGKIGVIYDTSDTYSSGIYEAFEARMAELNKVKGTDFFVYPFDNDNNKDFSAQIDGIKGNNCDVIFLPIYYTEAGLIAKAAAKTSYNVPLFGCDGLDNIAGQLDSSVTASVKYITPFNVNSTDEKVARFVNAFKAKYDTVPDQFAADGYDAVMIIFEAMKAAGVNDTSITASELCAKLVAVLTGSEFSYSGVTGNNMTWPVNDNGSCHKDPQIIEVTR